MSDTTLIDNETPINDTSLLSGDASSRTIWVSGQPFGNAYINIKSDNTVEAPIGAEIFNDFENNIASRDYAHAEGKGTIANNEAEHAEGKYNKSNTNTIHSVGIGTSNTDRKNAIEVMQNGDVYINGIGEYDGTTIETAKSLQEVAEDAANAIQITYAELKSLRDAGKLVPGQQYRITDYTCTTTQANTKSAGHVFDIIVTADDESTLNEVARAVKHEGDAYFANSDLNAWKIWYCLDNDTSRFAWADATNGKGVIYRMIDEWNNDVPYDFKNIQFYRKWDSTKSLWSTISSDSTGVPCYTFSYGGSSSSTSFTDMSLKSSNNIYSNIIKRYINSDNSNKQTLNNNCFFGDCCYSNTFGNNCHNNTFDYYCFYNLFGDDYSNNSFGNNCKYNIFGNNCYNNSFGVLCYNNSFGNDCDHNTFGNICYTNSFGEGCSSNSFGINCYSNSFGNSCYSNTFGNYDSYNSFGNECYHITFENGVYRNSFGNGCYNFSLLGQSYNNSFGNGCYDCSFGPYLQGNSFGNYCYNNRIGNDGQFNSFGNYCIGIRFSNVCHGNSLGNYCQDIKFYNDSGEYTYYRNNHFGDACKFITLTGKETASTNEQVQNYKFAQGVQGTADEVLTIDGKRNRSYETYISRDTDGTIKESVISEKLDKMIEISYADLVTLRNSSGLIPGQQYRITDYACTTTQAGTKSAGHVFDIIVTADDTGTLNEVARAALHSGDKYFSGCSLNAWKIWYCLDNDSDRFAWADGTNGKGVIYRMIDEFNNDVPYDFKNIQFYRQWNSSMLLWSTISSDNTGVPCYTFSSNGNSSTTSFTDMSLSISNEVHSNVIKEYININFKKQTLNNTCFFGDECYFNAFGNNCNNNTFGNSCYSNAFGNKCSDNSFGNSCYFNSFGNEFTANSFGNNCSNNSSGNICLANTFGYDCSSNSFGNDFSSNSFGNRCSYNSFGNVCQTNTFGNNCDHTTTGNGFLFNVLGNNCYSNIFENNCAFVKFTSDGDASTKYNYYQNNHFGDECQYIVFTGKETASSSSCVQNYNFAQGLQGTSDAYLAINGVRGRSFETKVAKNSSGTLKMYCEADLIL